MQSNNPVPPTPAEVRYRRETVDVVSTRPDAVLERRVNTKEETGAFIVIPWRSTESTWEQVCVSPCKGVELDRYSSYRVAGANGISSSSPFTLPQGNESVHLQIDAGNRQARRGGLFLTGVGTVALIVGGSLLLAAGNVDNHHDKVETRDAGWISGASGLVVLAIGIPLALLTRTTVFADDHPLRAADATPSKPRFTGNGFIF